MSVYHIRLKSESKDGSSYVGGTPMLKEAKNIPKIPNSELPQKLLLTLTSDFFKSPVIQHDECLSIFVSEEKDTTDHSRNMAVNAQDQLKIISSGYSKVLIHKKFSEIQDPNLSCFKKASVQLYDFTDAEIKEETSTPGLGTEYSKLNGIPGWLQDPINLDMKYQYWLQLNEYDLVKIDKSYDNIFRGGIGYLFLSRNIKKLNVTDIPQDAGYFFIQFT